MIGSKSLLVALISCGLGAGTMQIVHAASLARTPAAQKLDDDKYPHMRQALHDLKVAKESLRTAEEIFHGHREKAMVHVDQAIQECEDALAEG
jgi:hypothetical protein